MTSLYSLRSTSAPGEFTVMKFDEDYSVESVYALSSASCTCPQGHRPKCKHRRMLPLFLEHSHVDDGWFLDWDTRLWRHPLAEPDAPTPLADNSLLGNAEHAEEIAKRMAPAFASEGSNAALGLGAPSTNDQPSVPSGASSCEPDSAAGPQAIPPSKLGELRRRRI